MDHWTRMVARVVAMGVLLTAGGVLVRADSLTAGPADAPLVAAASSLPPGWEITAPRTEPQLVWHAGERVPVGGAAIEFYAEDRLLGRPVAAKDRRSFTLSLAGIDPLGLANLEVRAAGRRIDSTVAKPNHTAVQHLPAIPPRTPVDPGKPGPYSTVTGEYELPAVRLPGLSKAVEMQAAVVAPKGLRGRAPLVLFMHGRHDTCFKGASEENLTWDWPCVNGAKPIPSYRGFGKVQRLLASQGYITVSVALNGINGQDERILDGGAQARSALLRLHLANWADWAAGTRGRAPAVVGAAPVADLSQVLLVGHSRGGEGANRATVDSLSPPPAGQDGYRGAVRWTIRGNVFLAPMNEGQNPAPNVPSVTVLPGCDGDVADLQGQGYVDAARGVGDGIALHSAVYMIGANHNFFNSEWTPGQAEAPARDDADSDEPDPVCTVRKGSPRLTANQQQSAAATYIAAAARLFIRGDDRVRPLLDGSNVQAPSAGPARVLTHALGAGRTPLLVPDTSVSVVGGGAKICSQVHLKPSAACLHSEDEFLSSPHFVQFTDVATEAGRYAVALKWSKPGTPTSLRPAKPVSIADSQSVALRIIVPPNTRNTRLDVAVKDATGRRAVLGTVRLDGLPQGMSLASYWAQEVRVPLTVTARTKVNIRQIVAVELVPRSQSGRAWLMDAWGWRTGTPTPRPRALPRIDIGQLRVKEGDSGVRTYRLPVKVSGIGTGQGQVRIFLSDPDGKFIDRVVTLRAGMKTIDIPVKVRGDKVYDGDLCYSFAAKALREAVVGSYQGCLTVENDDKE